MSSKLRRPITEAHIIKRANDDAVLDYLWTYLTKKKKRKVLKLINENRLEENEGRRLSRIQRINAKIAKLEQTRDGLIECSENGTENSAKIVDYAIDTEYELWTLVRMPDKRKTICRVMQSNGRCLNGATDCAVSTLLHSEDCGDVYCTAEDRKDNTNITFIPVENSTKSNKSFNDTTNYEIEKEYSIDTIIRHNDVLAIVTADDLPDSDMRTCSACIMSAKDCTNADTRKHNCSRLTRTDDTSIHYREKK